MIKRAKLKDKGKRKFTSRPKNTARFQLPKNADIDYKNFTLLQKYLNDRGKIIPRRISEISAKEQRQLAISIKRARQLGLLISGGIKK